MTLTSIQELQARAHAKHQQFANTMNEINDRLTVGSILEEVLGEVTIPRSNLKQIPTLIAISGLAWAFSKKWARRRGGRSGNKTYLKKGELK